MANTREQRPQHVLGDPDVRRPRFVVDGRRREPQQRHNRVHRGQLLRLRPRSSGRPAGMFTTKFIAGEPDDCVEFPEHESTWDACSYDHFIEMVEGLTQSRPVLNEGTFNESTHRLSDDAKVVDRQLVHFMNCRTGDFCRRRQRCARRTRSSFASNLWADASGVVDPVLATVASCLVGRVGLRARWMGVHRRLDDDLRHGEASFDQHPTEFTCVQRQQPLCVPRGG